jgi:hypothetical protein
MRLTRIAATALISGVAAVTVYGTAFNMPMFTRKYDLECGSCHSVVPKLTKMGMEFRASGFRMPDEIGQPDKEVNNVSTQMATRLQARYDAARTDNAGTKSDKSQITFHEVTFYPLTGAFAKNYSSLFELSIGPEEPVEIENAYVRGDWKASNGFLSARAGIFHPFEGFGASDRPLAINRPLFQTTSAQFNQKTFFTPWGFDEAGLELGYTYEGTSLRAAAFNGLSYDLDENAAHPAQTGASGNAFAKDPARPGFHNTDIQLFFNQILNPNGGGVSLYYYRGALALPAVDSADPTAPTYWENRFDRYAAYASYPVVSRLILLAGAQQGKDKTYTLASGLGADSKSKGVFGEADVDLSRGYWMAGRYEVFDPSDQVAENDINAITVALNKPFNNGLQFISEFRRTTTKQGILADKVNDAFQTRLIWIW